MIGYNSEDKMIDKQKKKIVFSIALITIILITVFLVLPSSVREKGTVCFRSDCINVEIAKAKDAQEKGLMNRTGLDENAGMLFVFDHAGLHPFWMKNTLIPLDIIWLDQNGKVVYIEMNAQPCETAPCKLYTPPIHASTILEVNAWYAKHHNIAIGDVATIQVTL